MSTELIINASLPETRISLMESGEIQELLIERASGKGIVGNIYKGRVTRVLPGMQAAFVDIGLEKAAFLYVDDVYVHSEIWEDEEAVLPSAASETTGTETAEVQTAPAGEGTPADTHASPGTEAAAPGDTQASEPAPEHSHGSFEEEFDDEDAEDDRFDIDSEDDEEDDDEDDEGPMGMGPDEGNGNDQPSGTVSPQESRSESAPSSSGSENQQSASAEGQQAGAPGQSGQGQGEGARRRRHRRGRRGGRHRRREGEGEAGQPIQAGQQGQPIQQIQQRAPEGEMPEQFHEQISVTADRASDREGLTTQGEGVAPGAGGRPDIQGGGAERRPTVNRKDFNEPRSRDRRIRTKQAARPVRAQVNIQDLLKEGQEVIVQVAKDPIATKGARLTCHISLPGRHLVCMPTIDHVGVSRRIERDDERRKLRDFVERNRPRKLGFIVRTASGRGQYETRIGQDIQYLTRLWNEIREKAANVTAPALVYEDLNAVLRAIRDWVTEDIDKIIVDSRYHYNDIQRFVSHFMPSLRQKVELYHGDVPIFDAYNISTELARALERKVWLKSGGYIVIDQAEALVAIDVNTGRYVGKKNLEDTILKTNLEAVQEIAYQLRLRNCGGIIILDLIDMEKEENKHRVYRALEEALKKDRARPTILKISELGLVEMTRKRTRDTIVRALCDSCVQCEGKGFIKSKQTVAYEVLREIERAGIDRDMNKILVQAHADVIDILAIDEKETLDQLERRYRKQIYLQAVTEFHVEQFEVSGDKKPGVQARPYEPSRESSDRRRGRDRERGRGRGGKDRGGQEDRQGRDQERGGERGERGARGERGPREQRREAGPQAQQPEANLAADQQLPENIGQGPQGSQGHEDEDRLAFLRAQAAQDAALAKFRGGEQAQQNGQRGPGGPGGAGGEGRDGRGGRGRRGRRGRRGGQKFRGPGGGGLPKPVQGAPSDQSSSSAPSHSDSSGGGSGSGGDSGGPQGGGAGGSGHSQPPV